MSVKKAKIKDLIPDDHNFNTGNEFGEGLIEKSFAKFGAGRSILLDKNNRIIAGNKSTQKFVEGGGDNVLIVEADGNTLVAVKRTDIDLNTKKGREMALADNASAKANISWDFEALTEWEMPSEEWGVVLYEAKDEETEGEPTTPKVTLADRFLIPPFSVLDARQGYWQDRKRAWLDLGIESELGRGEGVHKYSDAVTISRANGSLGFDGSQVYKNNGLLGISEQARSHYKAAPGGSLRPAMSLENGKTVRGDGKGRPMANGKGLARCFGQDLMKGENLTWVKGNRSVDDLDEASRKILAAGPRRQAHTAATSDLMEMAGGFSASHQSGTSIFDPVLCELAYRWFTAEGFHVLDPFAGGSVRGIVASRLGRDYTGIELRPEQIAANETQAARICKTNLPAWLEGDSTTLDTVYTGETDFVFSCPPYADLEVYSDDPRDISTMPYKDFIEAYRVIIKKACDRLKDNRFALFTVGEVRDKKGIYRNFVADTVAAFQDAGLKYYNEAILVTAVGSLPIRVGRQFDSGRKLGKTHQNVLVFIKGDAKKAAAACGKVEITDIAEAYGEIA